MTDLGKVLKTNPYHDKDGKFSSKENDADGKPSGKPKDPGVPKGFKSLNANYKPESVEDTPLETVRDSEAKTAALAKEIGFTGATLDMNMARKNTTVAAAKNAIEKAKKKGFVMDQTATFGGPSVYRRGEDTFTSKVTGYNKAQLELRRQF